MLVRPLVSGYGDEYVRFLEDRVKGELGTVEQALDTWQLKASCRGPQAEIFFPPAHAERKDEKIQREDRAKSICRSCAVRVGVPRLRHPHPRASRHLGRPERDGAQADGRPPGRLSRGQAGLDSASRSRGHPIPRASAAARTPLLAHTEAGC